MNTGHPGQGGRGGRGAGSRRGMVTAELAVGTLAVTMMVALVAGVALVILTQLRCVDAASEIARQSARGDVAAVAEVRRTLPAETQVRVERANRSVLVEVTMPVALPLLSAVTVTGRAETVVEPGE